MYVCTESCNQLTAAGLSKGYCKFTAAGLFELGSHPVHPNQECLRQPTKQSNSKSFPSKRKRCVLSLDTSSYSSKFVIIKKLLQFLYMKIQVQI